MDWGWRGCAAAAARGDAVVIVDVIRFSTAVCAAISRGVAIYPANDRDDLAAMGERFDATQIENGLAPASYDRLERDRRIILRSPNGATCVKLANAAPIVLVGGLVNRSAVAKCIQHVLNETSLNVTAIACGERWTEPSEDGALRFAIEDYIGAGSILSLIGGDLSPEARACAGTFRAIGNVQEMLLTCGSGREQIAKGDRDSILYAASLDRHDIVPILRDGCRLEALTDISKITSLASNAGQS
jgi:2-phosphosulfolactate phosphatase